MSIQPQNTPVPSLEAHSSQRRTCDQLGLCQNRKPPCPGCTWRDTALFDTGVHHFAPGVIDAGPDKRPLLRRWGVRNGARWVGVGCLAATALVSCSYSVGYMFWLVGGAVMTMTLHPRIVAMLANPVNRAVVAYVGKRGAASKDDIASHLQAIGIDTMSSSRLSQLAGKGVLVNTTPRGSYARYVLGNRADLFDAPVPTQVQPKPELETEEDPVPGWVGQKTPPPAYDVMRAPVYVPPHMGSSRPGADDFRACQSRGHRC